MEAWKIIFPSKWVICRFHFNLPGCKGFPGKPSPFLFWIFFPVSSDGLLGSRCADSNIFGFSRFDLGIKKYFLQKSTTWAEILNTKKRPHPLKLRWIPQKMMGRLENLYIFSGFKLWQQSRYILGIYFRGENSHVKTIKTSHSLKRRRFVQVVEGQELRLGRSYRLCVDRSSEKMKRREVVKYQVVQSDLFGMVSSRDLLERLFVTSN